MSLRTTIGVAALAAACAPRGVSGPPGGLAGARYALTSIEARALPAPYAPDRGLDDRVVSGTLAFSADGRGRWELRVADAATGQVRTDDAELTYTVRGDRIAVSLDCPILASCVAPPHLLGRAVGDRIVFDRSAVTRVPLVYARAGQ